MENGVFDETVLETLVSEGQYLTVAPAGDNLGYAGWQWISRAAHDCVIQAAKEFYAATGVGLYVAEAFRSYDTQVYYFESRYHVNDRGGISWNGQTWTPNVGASAAAVPGTSIHGLGDAIDVWSGIDTSFTSPNHITFSNIAKKYGLTNTGVNFGEPWHFQFSTADVTAPVPVDTTPGTDSAGTGTTTPIGDEDLPLTDADAAKVASAIFNDPRFGTVINQTVVPIITGSAFAGSVASAVVSAFPGALDSALNTVTVPYAPSKGAANSGKTNLRNLFSDLRNKIFNG